MIYLDLFWTFFKIGLFTIGGGHAMIPLMQEEILAHGWMPLEQFIDFIAISEATPGAFAVNIATFVGSSLGGFLGAVLSTLAIVLPSLIIIITISKFFAHFSEKQVIKDAFKGLQPTVVALISYAFLSLCYSVLLVGFDITDLSTIKNVDYLALIIFAVTLIISLVPLKIKGKKRRIHPIFLIVISAILGIICYI